jgi:hypothetical protein
MTGTNNRVDLTDLDVIARYSLAVRTATADRDELIVALRSDLEWLQGGRQRRTSTPAAAPEPKTPAEPTVEVAHSPSPARARRSTPAKKTAPVKKTADKKTARVKKTAEKKAAPVTKVAPVKKAAVKKRAAREHTTTVKWADSPRRPAAKTGRRR